MGVGWAPLMWWPDAACLLWPSIPGGRGSGRSSFTVTACLVAHGEPAVSPSPRISRPCALRPAAGAPVAGGSLFAAIRFAVGPGCVPSLATVRCRPSPWPPGTAFVYPGSPTAMTAYALRPARGISARFEPVARLKDVKRRFLAYSFPPRLPDPPPLAVQGRPGFVRAAPALPSATRVRLPSATATCCDRPPAKDFHLHSDHSASRRKRKVSQSQFLVSLDSGGKMENCSGPRNSGVAALPPCPSSATIRQLRSKSWLWHWFCEMPGPGVARSVSTVGEASSEETLHDQDFAIPLGRVGQCD